MTLTDSLWPEQMFSSSKKGEIADFLEAQAAALNDRSSGRLSASITTSSIEQHFAFKFMVAPAGAKDQAFELFVTRCIAGQLPCAVENYHAEPLRSSTLDTLEKFQTHLKALFRHPRTLEILQLLMSEAEPSLSSVRFPATVARVESIRFDPEGTPDSKPLVKLRLRDLVGYLRAEDVGKLLGEPDEPNTNFKLLNDDQYLMYVGFAAPVGIPISRSEIDQLQASVKAALAEWDAEDRLRFSLPGQGAKAHRRRD